MQWIILFFIFWFGSSRNFRGRLGTFQIPKIFYKELNLYFILFSIWKFLELPNPWTSKVSWELPKFPRYFSMNCIVIFFFILIGKFPELPWQGTFCNFQSKLETSLQYIGSSCILRFLETPVITGYSYQQFKIINHFILRTCSFLYKITRCPARPFSKTASAKTTQ